MKSPLVTAILLCSAITIPVAAAQAPKESPHSLLAALGSSSATERQEAAIKLVKLVETDAAQLLGVVPQHLSSVRSALDDPDAETSGRMLAVLYGLLMTDVDQVGFFSELEPQFVGILRQSGFKYLDLTLRLLSGINPLSPDAIEVCEGLANDSSRQTRMLALYHLVRSIGPARQADVNTRLKDVLSEAIVQDPNRDVRSSVVRNIGIVHHGDAAMVPLVLPALGDEDNEVVRQAISSLINLSPPVELVEAELRALVRDDTRAPQVREFASQALERLRNS